MNVSIVRKRASAGAAGQIRFVGGMLLVTGLVATAEPARSQASLLEPVLTINGSDPGVPFSNPQGIALDPKHGEILLAHSGMHRVEIFDMHGFRRGYFTHSVPGRDGSPMDGEPIALAVTPAGQTLVSDRYASYVDVVDYRGRSLARLELGRGGAADPGHGPGAIAIAPDGRILVAARGDSGRVFEFAPSFTKSGEWGEAGSHPGQLSEITGIAVTPDDRVVVTCENTQMAVQLFERAGRYLSGFGVHEIGQGNFSFASSVVVTRDGRIWTADGIRQLIQVFSPAGEFQGAVGGPGVKPGEFRFPAALASDGDSLVAIVERDGNRFQVMRIR